jgi:hypothetical protein
VTGDDAGLERLELVGIGRLLDRDLQTEIGNLFVRDDFVIPDPWGLPPSLTLIGLAKRLAAHLAARPHQAGGNERSPARPAENETIRQRGSD